MQTSFLEILHCPDDGASPLTLYATRDSGGEVETGALVCPSCSRIFPIRSGVPSLLPRCLPDDADRQAVADLAGSLPAAVLAHSREREAMGPLAEGEAERAMLSEMATRDEESSWYDVHYDDKAYRFELETYVRQLDAQPAEKILDIGCGTGRVTKEYLGEVGFLVAADFSMESLLYFRNRLDARLKAKVAFARCAVGHIPLPDSHFDAAVSTSLFSNVPTLETREAGLREVHRVLAPDSRFLITVYNHCLLKRVRSRLGLSRSGLKQGWHSGGSVPYYNFDPGEFVRWLSPHFTPGPCFGLMHRVPVVSRLSPTAAEKLDRMLYHTPFSLRVVAKEMGMVARKAAVDQPRGV